MLVAVLFVIRHFSCAHHHHSQLVFCLCSLFCVPLPRVVFVFDWERLFLTRAPFFVATQTDRLDWQTAGKKIVVRFFDIVRVLFHHLVLFSVLLNLTATP